MIEKIVRLSFFKTSRKTAAPFGGLATAQKTLGGHQVLQITPRILKEEGEVLVKDNWIIQNLADPDRFNHFLVHISNPQAHDPNKPVLILLPGIFCNGNLFRIVRSRGNFRDLNTHDSFANELAYQGYHVVLPHPRYAQWIYRRYVQKELGVKNFFSDAVSFERLKNDIPFFLDVAQGLTKSRRAVIIGFSMGGMEVLDYLSRNPISPHLAGVVMIATPGYFSREQFLVLLLKIYNYLAGISISERHQLLKVISRNINPLKYVLKTVPPTLLSRLPLASELFNPRVTNLETIIPVISYVLEPITSAMVEYFQLLARRGDFVSADGETKILDGLREKSLPPSLLICGTKDKLATEKQMRVIEKALPDLRHFELIQDAGHVDLITGGRSPAALEKILWFLSEIPPK